MPAQNPASLAWEAHEFRHYEKTIGWYVSLFAISILIIGFFVIVQKDIFAAVCLAILTICVYFFARHRPQKVLMELNPKSIHFGNLIFPYKQIKYFWVVSNQNHRTLNFHTTAFLNNLVIIELEEQDPEQIRDYLIRYIPEHTETDETSVQKIMHKLKF